MFTRKRVWFALLHIIALLPLSLIAIGFTGVSRATAAPHCGGIPLFDPSNFSNSTTIDNQFLPMIPGTRLVLEGEANRGGGGARPHRVVFIVTDLTKVINGVRTVVVLDRDIEDGQLVERELAFFAQDNDGNVWNLGEYPEEYEDGEFADAPDIWIAGLAGAEAGIHMRGVPVVEETRYLQGYAPEIEFLDCAKVIQMGEMVTVPAGSFENVLITDEISPLDREGGRQLKYHAPGVGIVQVGAINDPEGETLSLVRHEQLDPIRMERIRTIALDLEKRAYKFSPDLYGQTMPAEYIAP